MRLIFIFYFLLNLTLSNALIAQVSNRSLIKSMFDKTNEGLWISYYEGLFDDTFPISLELGTSENQCRGILNYSKSKTRFTVEGHIEDGVYLLAEYDRENRMTASIKLSVQDKKLVGEWIDINGKVKYNIVLTKKHFIKESKASPFYNRYYTNYNHTVHLEIHQSIHNQKILLNINDRIIEWVEYDKNKLQYELLLIEKQVSYRFIELKDNKILVKIKNNELEENIHLEQVNELDFDVKSMMNYSIKGEIHYPTISDQKFKDWMKEEITHLWNEELTILKEDDTSPHNRFDQEIFIHAEVTFYNQNFMSGLFLVENKQSSVVKTIPFLYSFVKKEELDIDRLFDRNQKEEICQHYIEIENTNNAFLKGGIRKKWLMNAPYKYMVIGMGGFDIYTDYNLLYGNNHVHIPFGEVKDQLKESLKSFLY